MRDHSTFREPFSVATNKTVERPTPEGFRSAIDSATVPLLPLVSDQNRSWRNGWCTYTDHFEKNPDVEVMCGGANDKAVTAAAIWRQGNLLHFGFEQSPDEMNETGRRLLLNSIAYISRFTEDQPIAVTPSVFAGPAALPRTYIDRRVLGKSSINEVEWMVVPDLAKKLIGMAPDERRKWYEAHRAYLRPSNTPEKRLEIDPAARALKAPLDSTDFFQQCIAALEGEHAEMARQLLHNYGPKETDKLTSAGEWKSWFANNEKYLFFSDQADYRWYIDPLAKKRGIPSAKLRGSARASKP